MKSKLLIGLLHQGDFAKFKEMLLQGELIHTDSDDEARFFAKAPKQWLSLYLDLISPSPKAERVLMLKRVKLFEQSCYNWGVSNTNMVLALEECSMELCIKIIKILRNRPTTDAEIAMINRNNRSLFYLWINRFGELSEDAERMLEEKSDFINLKHLYIDWYNDRHNF